MYRVKVVKDSISEAGVRLTTFECEYPRWIHSQVLTHRLFSRNSSSSRAIPTARLAAKIVNDPVYPLKWGKNQRGMQAYEEVSPEIAQKAKDIWDEARNFSIIKAEELSELGIHKQIVNRIMEPYMFITVIITATEFANFYHLRRAEDAQPEIAWLANEMYQKAQESEPSFVGRGAWHLPYVETRDRESPLYVPREYAHDLKKISTARCARVSYLTHDGQRDFTKDIELHDQLWRAGHWSPFEHVATPIVPLVGRSGNFFGWKQYRKDFMNEHYGKFME